MTFRPVCTAFVTQTSVLLQQALSRAFFFLGLEQEDRNAEGNDHDGQEYPDVSDQAHQSGDTEPDRAEVGISVSRAKLCQAGHLREEHAAENLDQADCDARNEGGLFPAVLIAEYTGDAPVEEGSDNAGDHHDGRAHQQKHRKSQKLTDECADKAQNGGHGGQGEEHGHVQAGDRIGDQLIGDALKRGHQLGDHHANAGEQNHDTDGEAGAQLQRVHHPVSGDVRKLLLLYDIILAGNQRDAAENQRHQKTGHNRGIIKDGRDPLEVDGILILIMNLRVGGLIVATHQLADPCTEHRGGSADVAQSKIVSDKGLGIAVYPGRHNRPIHTAEEAGGENQGHAFHLEEPVENPYHKRGEGQHRMSAQEHIFQRREPGKHKIEQEADQHHNGNYAEHRFDQVVVDGRHTGIVFSDNAGNVKRFFQNVHDGAIGGLKQRRTLFQDHNTDDRFDHAFDDIARAFFLDEQADQDDHAHNQLKLTHKNLKAI